MFKLQALCSYKYILIFFIINVRQDDGFFLTISWEKLRQIKSTLFFKKKKEKKIEDLKHFTCGKKYNIFPMKKHHVKKLMSFFCC